MTTGWAQQQSDETRTGQKATQEAIWRKGMLVHGDKPTGSPPEDTRGGLTKSYTVEERADSTRTNRTNECCKYISAAVSCDYFNVVSFSWVFRTQRQRLNFRWHRSGAWVTPLIGQLTLASQRIIIPRRVFKRVNSEQGHKNIRNGRLSRIELLHCGCRFKTPT